MRLKRQYLSVVAICVSIILASVIIAKRPQESARGDLWLPVGVPPSLGTISSKVSVDGQTKTISLSGTGTAYAKANQAYLTLGVQTENSSASVAVEENARLMNAVVSALKGLGIGEERMETVSYGVSPIYDSTWQKVIGYRVVNLLRVRLQELSLIGRAIDEAGRAGANRMEGISFGLSSELQEQLKLEAYRKALNDASSKARLIAETLNLKITGVLSFSESVYYPYPPTRGIEVMADKGATPIFEGALSVSVTVNIVYTFE
ncbi:SIMPL domain-containing protein [Candidatus Bathyarchaeota archaeon]|nr:SIMPL domain-containing protein [Candidatus Bathyarchaeota archaeon]